jgi:choline dehydrogenase-like flavoprotein
LSHFRVRHFGGSSAIWGGWCRALDAADFEPKPHHPRAHWPIRKADLDPHLPAALAMVEVAGIPRDEVLQGTGFRRVHFGWSPPTRFGTAYRTRVVDHPDIFLCLHANATHVLADDRRVTGIALADFAGRRATAVAGAYVPAAGGVENGRLLLWSNEVTGGRVVERPGTLGRFWMDHPTFTLGDFVGFRRLEGQYFSFTPERRRVLGLLNCGLRFDRHDDAPVAGLLEDLARVAPRLGAGLRRRLGAGGVIGGVLRASWEQELRAGNRVALSGRAVDRFGIPRPVLHWTKSAEDLVTVQRTALAFGEVLAAADIARVRLRDWVLGNGDYPEDDERTSNHHLRGTRMADSPEEGVVDADLRVHGQPDLFVLGSSVFPSGGFVNPTVTILQLAGRLAGHLIATAASSSD